MFLVAATPRWVFAVIVLGRRFLNHDATTEKQQEVGSFFCNGERWPKIFVAKRVALGDNALAKKIGD